MPTKRPPISFPELEPRGKGAILRSAEEVAAEEEALEEQDAGITESQTSAIPYNQQTVNPASQQASKSEGPRPSVEVNRALYPKATYRLSHEAIEALEDARRLLRRTHQVRASREQIVEAAILAAVQNLNETQHASFLISHLSGIPGSQNTRDETG